MPTFTGDEGANTLTGTSSDDVINGNGGNDSLAGLGGNDSLSGGEGNDYLNGGAGDDTLDGGAGIDAAFYYAETPALGGVTVDLSISGPQNTLLAGYDTLIGIENLFGTIAADTLSGDDNDNYFFGDDGNDTLSGRGGNDRLDGGTHGNDIIDGGSGSDTALFLTSLNNLTLSLAVAGPQVVDADGRTITLISIENVSGGIGNDRLTGDAGSNILNGGYGQDTLIGGSGDDVYVGVMGDFIVEEADGGTDEVQTLGSDHTLEANVENLTGTSTYAQSLVGNDLGNIITLGVAGGQIYAGAGNDTANGSSASDVLHGEGGDDTLNGDDGNDVVHGGSGNDAISGGVGSDSLTGGSGADTFIDTAANLSGDTITDFDFDDRIVISDADLSGFSFSLSGNTLSFTGGSLTFTNLPTTNIVAGAAAGGGVQLTLSDEGTTADNPNVQQGVLGNSTPVDLQISQDGSKIYTTTGDGNLHVYSVATGSLIQTLSVGADLGAMDISPDGTFALVVERTPVSSYANQWGGTNYVVTMHKVDLATGVVTNFNFDAGGDHVFSDVAVLADGTALLTQNLRPGYSGWINPKVLDLATGQYSATNISVPQGSIIFALSDGSSALLSEANVTGNAIYVYEPGTGFERLPFGGGAANYGIRTMSPSGEWVAIDDYGSGVQLYNRLTSEYVSLPEQYANWSYGVPAGLAFSPDSQFLFVLDSDTNTIVQLSTNDWSVVAEFAAGEDVSSNVGGSLNRLGNMLLVAPDMSFFAVVGSGGVILVDPTAPRLPTDGNDSLFGSAAYDIIDGLGGDDYIRGLGGDDHLTGSGGNDRIYGGDGVDTLVGGGGWDQLDGGSGNDLVDGGAGNDILAGGEGGDTLNGGDGDDTLYSVREPSGPGSWLSINGGLEVDTLIGGAGDDKIYAGYGDNADGGSDSYGDTLYITFAGASSGLTFDFGLETQVIGGGTITGFEHVGWVQGTDYDDNIDISATAPVDPWSWVTSSLLGMGGNDVLVGAANTSLIDGGDGDDNIDGRALTVYANLIGGLGNDLIRSSVAVRSTANGGAGDDTIFSYGWTYGGEGNDTITLLGSPDYYIGYVGTTGGAGDDHITGSEQADGLSGGSGADTITGGGGGDYLFSYDVTPGSGWSNESIPGDAGTEHDVLSGGAGDDHFSAGYGDDIDGGDGTDVLRLNFSGASAGFSLNTADLAQTGFSLGGGQIQRIELIDQLVGSNYADVLTVAAQSASILVRAGGGDDQVTVSSDASVDAGAGNDTVRILAGTASVFAGDGDDLIFSGPNFEYLYGGNGVDTVSYANSLVGVTINLLGPIPGQSDYLVSIENLDGSEYADSLTGGWSSSALTGRGGDDTINGASGDDTLDGGSGSDTLVGGAGNDILRGGEGNNFLIGGVGNDVYYVTDSQDIILEDLDSGDDALRTTVSYSLGEGAAVERLYAYYLTGSPGITLIGNEFGQEIWGGDSADLLIASAGNDIVFGGLGNDQIDGGYGNDTLYGGEGDDVIVGREDDDLLIGSGGNDLMIGDIGNDAIDGGLGNDSLFGGEGNDVLVGREGDDLLFGSEGNDLLIGDIGNDQLDGGTGEDTLDGGEGNDILVGRDGDDLLLGSGGNDLLIGSEGDDRIDGGSGADQLDGGVGNDVLVGREGDDLLLGSSGNDLLIGSDGNDLIDGGSGNDQLDGGDGNDVLNGGGGADVLVGGAGADLFAFREIGGMVRILDFVSGSDHIDLSSVDANSGLGGDQAFVYLGSGAFTNTAGQLRDYSDGTNHYLLGDIDGNGSEDLVINLGSANAVAADLIL
ncbi:MAG: calcium-binding protein [Sphingomicrobium sp.]